jgi:hypothetical protein
LLLGVLFTDIDLLSDSAGRAGFLIMTGILLANIIWALVAVVLAQGQRPVLAAGFLFELWVALAATFISSSALDGFGRHWK